MPGNSDHFIEGHAADYGVPVSTDHVASSSYPVFKDPATL
jgi:hypothetical protein